MYRIRAKGALTWNVIKGLTAKTELSLNRNWNQEKTWNAGQTEKDNSSAKLKKSDGYGVRWATTLNYEVQGLEMIIICLSWLVMKSWLQSQITLKYMV